MPDLDRLTRIRASNEQTIFMHHTWLKDDTYSKLDLEYYRKHFEKRIIQLNEELAKSGLSEIEQAILRDTRRMCKHLYQDYEDILSKLNQPIEILPSSLCPQPPSVAAQDISQTTSYVGEPSMAKRKILSTIKS